MAMQKLQVGQIRGAVEDSRAHVINLDVSPVNKERTTPGTLPLLSLEQDGDPARGQRVLPQALGPVHEVGVEWAGVAAHFHVALDRCISVAHQAQTGWC